MGSVQIDRSTPVGIFIMAFGCLVLSMAFIGPWKDYRWQKKLATEGIRVTAEVKALDRKWTSGSGSGKQTRQYFYTIEYAFEAEGGGAVTGSCMVWEDKWRKLGPVVVGSTIQVIYHKDDPQRGHPVGLERDKMPAIAILAMGTFGVLFVALGMAVVIRSRRNERLSN